MSQLEKGFPTHSTDINGKPIRLGDYLTYDFNDNETFFQVVFEDNAFRKKYRNWKEYIEKPLLEYGGAVTNMRLVCVYDCLANNGGPTPEKFMFSDNEFLAALVSSGVLFAIDQGMVNSKLERVVPDQFIKTKSGHVFDSWVKVGGARPEQPIALAFIKQALDSIIGAKVFFSSFAWHGKVTSYHVGYFGYSNTEITLNITRS
jgi:hypothetical protein